MSAPLPAGIGVTRGPRGPCPTQIFRTYSHLCFERQYPKQNSGTRLKSSILSPTKIFSLLKLLGWLRFFLQGQIAKLASGLCSLQVTILGVLSHMTAERRHVGR